MVAGALAAGKSKSVPGTILQLAAAVEFIHSATLLHDDVIDKSDQRRGRDTANALWAMKRLFWLVTFCLPAPLS